jgi:hypothetical protein
MVFRDVADRFGTSSSGWVKRVIGQKEAVGAANRLVMNKDRSRTASIDRTAFCCSSDPRVSARPSLRGGCGIPLRRREEDDPHRHVRYQDGGVSIDKLIGMPDRRQSARWHPHQSAEDNPCQCSPREIEKASESAEPVPAGFDEG